MSAHEIRLRVIYNKYRAPSFTGQAVRVCSASSASQYAVSAQPTSRVTRIGALSSELDAPKIAKTGVFASLIGWGNWVT